MKNRMLYAATAVLMFVLGASDSMRGVFSPLFTEGFGLTVSQMGLIVSGGFLGNITLLLIGGSLMDRFGARKCFTSFIILLALSELFLMIGRSFLSLGAGFFLALGFSTLLNMTITLISGIFSEKKALMYLNILFFVQQIGMTLSQFILTRKGDSASVWMATLVAFAAILVPVAIVASRSKCLDDVKKSSDDSIGTGPEKTNVTVLFFLALSMGFYMVAEHGVVNYIVIYGTNLLGKNLDQMAGYLALFSAGMMVGRLCLSPVIDRVGDRNILLACFCGLVVTTLLIFRFDILFCVFFMGLSCSVLYPTASAMVRKYASAKAVSRITAIVISSATLIDVLFNLVYGSFVDSLGYRGAMMMLFAASVLGLLTYIPVMIGGSFKTHRNVGMPRVSGSSARG